MQILIDIDTIKGLVHVSSDNTYAYGEGNTLSEAIKEHNDLVSEEDYKIKPIVIQRIKNLLV